MAAYLVMGATSHQGGATARFFLEAGAKIHPLTRDPLSESAHQLEDQGASIFKIRDFKDLGAIREAAKGFKGIFLNLARSGRGKFAASGLLDPDRFNGEEIDLGFENLTAEETRAILSKVAGRNIKARRRNPE
ncbi:hypothetical protein DL764_001328 [Monosporascus ibericus]|uniref:NmrA-like domain-containing protein n=1 Tax=Monosporascus ibericus TaxID=155417 RepID=A0A4Q4TTG5_9PEZI|nr:hypothetical protein DL764_001328 [Monosporascus ibericus]